VRSWKPLTYFPSDSELSTIELQFTLNNLILELQSGINNVKNYAETGTINRSNNVNQQIFMFEDNESLSIVEDGILVNNSVYFSNKAIRIYGDESGNLVFVDKNNTAITLSDIVSIANMYWSFGSAYGVKFANAAGTEKMIGLMEDADGITLFNDTSEVE